MPDPAPEWTIGRLIEWTRDFFAKKGVEPARLEAEILLAHALGLERIQLYMRYEEPVPEGPRATFRDLVRRRAAREPTRYLVGECEFMSLVMKVTPAVLIPRPETELLVEEVLRRRGVRRGRPAAASADAAPGTLAPGLATDPAAGPVSILDLCTGSGCVAVSAAVHLPTARVAATDLSAEALEVARTNAQAHGVADRVTFLQGDLYEALDAADAKPADFVLANPPYVAEREWADLEPEVRDHEPRQALLAGPDGTEVIARVVAGAAAYLVPGGTLLVEIGAGQGAAARELAGRTRGLADAEILKDYAGLDRVLAARRA